MLFAIVAFAAIKTREKGDFIGYVNAGHNVLKGDDIYADLFNTWPPVFSILSVPIALLDDISPFLSRGIWMVLMLWAYAAVIRRVLSILEKRDLTYKDSFNMLCQPSYLMAFFFCIRALMDNIMYLQINIMMLLFVCLLWTEKRNKLNSIALGLSIGAKIYNVFILPAYVLFRKWKTVLYASAGILLTLVICWTVYGFEQTSVYFNHWVIHRATDFQTIEHRNQSLIASLARLLSADNERINDFYHFAALSNAQIKMIYNVIVLVFATLFLFKFRKFFRKDNAEFLFETQIFIIAAIPLLTPLAWKANYIYVLPALFYLFNHWGRKVLNTFSVRMLFSGCVLLTFSNEAIIGREAMYFLENCNVLVLGEILILLALFLHFSDKYKSPSIV